MRMSWSNVIHTLFVLACARCLVKPDAIAALIAALPLVYLGIQKYTILRSKFLFDMQTRKRHESGYEAKIKNIEADQKIMVNKINAITVSTMKGGPR